jgi:general secretion pathway protein L
MRFQAMFMRQHVLRPLAPGLAGAYEAWHRLRKPVQTFLSWWAAELAACVPPAVKGFLARPGQLVELVIINGAATFQTRRAGQIRQLARIGLARNEEAAARRMLEALRVAIRPGRTRIRLSLSATQVLRRRIELPVAVVENMREVLELELDRHTPFRPAEVYFDHRIAGFDDDGKRVIVELAVVPRRLADRALAIARALGYPPEQIGIEGDDGVNFLPAGGANADIDTRRQPRFARAAVAAAFVLLLALPWLALHRTLGQEETRVAELRQQAAAVDVLRHEIQTLLKRNRSLIERKQHEPTLVSVLDELSRVLPDGTWVSELRLDGNKLSLIGYSKSASALIGVIEDSKLFKETQFGSPVLLDPDIGAERFNILATVTDG